MHPDPRIWRVYATNFRGQLGTQRIYYAVGSRRRNIVFENYHRQHV